MWHFGTIVPTILRMPAAAECQLFSALRDDTARELQEQSEKRFHHSKVDLASVMGKKRHPGLGLAEGYFGFAGHNDPVAFRNLSISAPADK